MQFLPLKMPASLMRHPCWTQMSLVFHFDQSSKPMTRGFFSLAYIASSFGSLAYPEVLAAVQAAQLPGLTVPPDVLGSGRKSFTLAPRFEEMKHLKADDKVKALEVKFYPYLAWIACQL